MIFIVEKGKVYFIMQKKKEEEEDTLVFWFDNNSGLNQFNINHLIKYC